MPFNFSLLTQSKYTFEGKRENETVEIFLYSHWIVIALKTVFYALVGLIPLGPLLIFSQIIIDKKLLGVALVFLVAYYLVLWSAYFYEIMIYLLDTWIVTNERVVDIVQKRFFYRTTAELDLTRVQDIAVRTNGLIQTFFDFGDVEIQSAGATNKFLFKQVPHPNVIKDQIMKLAAEANNKSKDL